MPYAISTEGKDPICAKRYLRCLTRSSPVSRMEQYSGYNRWIAELNKWLVRDDVATKIGSLEERQSFLR